MLRFLPGGSRVYGDAREGIWEHAVERAQRPHDSPATAATLYVRSRLEWGGRVLDEILAACF